MPRSGASDWRNIRPVRLLLRRARDLDGEAVRRRSPSGWSAAPARGPAGATVRPAAAVEADGLAGRDRQRRSASANARPAQSRRAARPRSGPCRSRAIRASSCWPGCRSPICAWRTVSICTNTSSPSDSSDPVDEAIALDAIEPFDLHRLELAGRVGKRLAVGPLGRRNGRARLLRARPSTGRSRGSCLRLQAALGAPACIRSIAPSGRLRRP